MDGTIGPIAEATSLLTSPVPLHETSKPYHQSLIFSTKSPQAAFSVKVTRPYILRPGNSFEIEIEFMPMETDAVRHALARGKGKLPVVTSVPMPHVTLSSAKLEFICETHLRTGSLRAGRQDDWEETMFVLTKPPKKSTPATNAEGPNSEVVCWSSDAFSAHQSLLGSLLSCVQSSVNSTYEIANGQSSLTRKFSLEVPIPNRLAPTFKSFTVARTYKVTLALEFECAGQRQGVYYRLPNVLVQPPNGTNTALDWGPYKLKSEGALLYETMAQLGIGAALVAWEIGSYFLPSDVAGALGFLIAFI